MAQYYDQDGYPARPTSLLKVLTCLCVIALAFVAVVTQWQTIAGHLPTTGAIILIATPTVGTAPVAPAQPRISAPAVPRAAVPVPALTLDQINATSIAIYQATAAAAEPVPNQDNTGDTAPLTHESAEFDRQPAPAYAPTAEPQPVVDDQFGSKQAPINIQETHQCKHGQIWTDSGCKNPTPVQ